MSFSFKQGSPHVNVTSHYSSFLNHAGLSRRSIVFQVLLLGAAIGYMLLVPDEAHANNISKGLSTPIAALSDDPSPFERMTAKIPESGPD